METSPLQVETQLLERKCGQQTEPSLFQPNSSMIPYDREELTQSSEDLESKGLSSPWTERKVQHSDKCHRAFTRCFAQHCPVQCACTSQFCTPSTAQPVWALERGSENGLGIAGSISNNCAALKDICVEALWCLQVNHYLQSEIYAQGFGIPTVTLIPQSATKHSGVLSAFKNPHLSKFLKWSFMWGEKPLLDISATLFFHGFSFTW